jgi:hypothetical protein
MEVDEERDLGNSEKMLSHERMTDIGDRRRVRSADMGDINRRDDGARAGANLRRSTRGYQESAKYSRTLAAICRSVILSSVSTAAIRPPSFIFSSRFLNSPVASPGPKKSSDPTS